MGDHYDKKECRVFACPENVFELPLLRNGFLRLEIRSRKKCLKSTVVEISANALKGLHFLDLPQAHLT